MSTPPKGIPVLQGREEVNAPRLRLRLAAVAVAIVVLALAVPAVVGSVITTLSLTSSRP